MAPGDVEGHAGRHQLLVTLTGQDRPGIAATLFGALDAVDARVTDIGQITIKGHLVICVELECSTDVAPSQVRRSVLSSPCAKNCRMASEWARSCLARRGTT